MQPWQLLLAGVAGWRNRKQQRVIEYLVEEHRVLREQLGSKRLSFSESQKRRLESEDTRKRLLSWWRP